MAQPYRNGAEVLVKWKQWRKEVWDPCPFGSLDKTKCSTRLCPCSLLQINRWVNGVSGYLGTVKLVKYLATKNGKGGGNGSSTTGESRKRIKAG
jgi:hypothetical protein